jgi:mannan endo-1,4-beta-mannosidase
MPNFAQNTKRKGKAEVGCNFEGLSPISTIRPPRVKNLFPFKWKRFPILAKKTMAQIKLYLLLAVFIILSSGCNRSARNETKPELSTEKLRNTLASLAGQHTLIGHQHALSYGVGWKGIHDYSDIKGVTGSHPAVFGWDIGHIGDSLNIDGVPFDSIREGIILAHKAGGINTISWHARNPITSASSWDQASGAVSKIVSGGGDQQKFEQMLDLVADFLQSLEIDGEKIPVIFRPWHEMNGSWFWWGSDHCSTEEFIALFRHTVDYLRNTRSIDNILVAYSPDRMFSNAEEYLTWYPGDEYIDILGLDNYYDFILGRLDLVVQRLGIVSDVAMEKKKIAAFTETGCDRITTSEWFTKNLLHVLKANEKTRRISYVLLWRNADTSHFYVPFPGHSQAKDFITFASDKHLLLLNEFNEFQAD